MVKAVLNGIEDFVLPRMEPLLFSDAKGSLRRGGAIPRCWLGSLVNLWRSRQGGMHCGMPSALSILGAGVSLRTSCPSSEAQGGSGILLRGSGFLLLGRPLRSHSFGRTCLSLHKQSPPIHTFYQTRQIDLIFYMDQQAHNQTGRCL